VNVTLREAIPDAVKVAYCRFGSTIVRVASARGPAAVCVAPPHAAEEVAFAFSYDTSAWSTEAVRFAFIEDDDLGDLLRMTPVLLAAGAIAAAVCCVCRYAAAADRKVDEGVGIAPLVRNEADSDDEQREPFVPKKRGHVD
jgi:hypothetical protein